MYWQLIQGRTNKIMMSNITPGMKKTVLEFVNIGKNLTCRLIYGHEYL